ncbi:MAG: hypothetical protein RIE56_04115 [Amphiplicatus sp.]
MNIATRAVLLILCLISGVSCGQASDDPRSVAFRDDCGAALQDIEKTNANINASGWRVVKADAHPELKAVMAFAESLDAELVSSASVSYFQKSIENFDVFLVLTHLPFEGEWLNGCYIYDFDETNIDRSSVIARWLGEEPTETINHPNLVYQQKWVGPKLLPEMATIRIGVIAEGGSVATQAGFSGAVWAATAIAE